MSSKTLVPTPAPTPHVAPPPPALDAFLDKHFRQILIAVGVLILVLVGYGVLRYRNHQEAEAAAIEATQAKTEADCDLVVQHHPGTIAAGDVQLTKAKLLWDKNKKDTAIAVLREFVQKYPDHPFHVQGMIGLASRLESMGSAADVAEAKGLYETVVKEPGKSELGGLAQMRLGDMLWNQGKEDEAKKIYEALPPKLTGSPFFEQNEERLKWLAAGLPTKEVEGPKPPPEPPSLLKKPTGPAMNLNSGKGGSPLGDVMSTIKQAVPGAKVTANPVAVPAPPKPGLATPGASVGIPVQGKTGTVQSQPITVPAAPKAPATATSPPVQVPAPAPAPAPAVTTPAPAPAAPATTTPAPAAPVTPPAAATPAPAPATPPATTTPEPNKK